MKFARIVFLAFITGCVLLTARTASAAGTADPGFAFVDVNGDGLYNPAIGDIGLQSSPSVDINSLILSDGKFDTQVSKGAYHAQFKAVSLVIPPSVTLTLTVPLNLRAGLHLIVHGTLTAPAISLQANANVDMTNGSFNFLTALNGTAGSNAILSGASVTGFDYGQGLPSGQINIQASGAVTALPTSAGFYTSFFASTYIGVWAGRTLTMKGGFIEAAGPASSILIGANGTVSITADPIAGGTLAAPNGYVNANSKNSGATMRDIDVQGAQILTGAAGDLDVTGSQIESSGPITLQATGKLTADNSPSATSLPTNIAGDGLSVKSGGGLDLSKTDLVTFSKEMSVDSSAGTTSLASAILSAAGGLYVHAAGNIDLSGASMAADLFYQFISDGGGLHGADSTITPFTNPTAATYISVSGQNAIDLSRAHWTTSSGISVQSAVGNLAVALGVFTLNQGSAMSFFAGGGAIDATGANFVSVSPATGTTPLAPTYGPSTVTITQ